MTSTCRWWQVCDTSYVDRRSRRKSCAYLKEVEHGSLEQWCIGIVGPLIFPLGVPVATNLVRLLVVWGLGFQRRNLCWIGRLCHSFTANLDIAPIRSGILPCKRVLHIEQIRLLITRASVASLPHLDIRGECEEHLALKGAIVNAAVSRQLKDGFRPMRVQIVSPLGMRSER